MILYEKRKEKKTSPENKIRVEKFFFRLRFSLSLSFSFRSFLHHPNHGRALHLPGAAVPPDCARRCAGREPRRADHGGQDRAGPGAQGVGRGAMEEMEERSFSAASFLFSFSLAMAAGSTGLMRTCRERKKRWRGEKKKKKKRKPESVETMGAAARGDETKKKKKKTQPLLLSTQNLQIAVPVRRRLPRRALLQGLGESILQGQARHLPLLRQRLDLCAPRRRRQAPRGAGRPAAGEGGAGEKGQGRRCGLEARGGEDVEREREREGFVL